MLVNEYNTLSENVLSKLSAEELNLQETETIKTYSPDQNYLNPFNPTTTKSYQWELRNDKHKWIVWRCLHLPDSTK